MRERKFTYKIESEGRFWWLNYNTKEKRHTLHASVEIINDNIARAACEAFLEVEINGHE